MPLRAVDAMKHQRPTADDLLGPEIAIPYRDGRVAARQAAHRATLEEYVDSDEMAHLELTNRGPKENLANIRTQVETFTRANLGSRALSSDPVAQALAQDEFADILRPILNDKGIELG